MIGTTDRKNRGQHGRRHVVIQEIIPGDFNFETFYDDIALLKVSPPIDFTMGHGGQGAAWPICLHDEEQIAGSAIIAGWGDVHKGDESGDDDLMYIKINILSDNLCLKYANIFRSNVMLCAGYTSGQKDACQVNTFLINL